MTMNLPIIKRTAILALGAESAGVFALYKNGDAFISENFGDLLDDNNFLEYRKTVFEHLRKEKIKPNIILTDLHPLYKTTIFGEELASKYKIPHIKIQHHIAHIFSAVGDFIFNSKFKIQNSKFLDNFIGIAMDGTGYGLDGNIWGGEVFRIQIPNPNFQITNKSQISNFENKITRIGSLEEQIMIGGDSAVREPARMLIAILAKITNPKFQITNKSKITNLKKQKDFIYKYIKKFYNRNEFEALYNQLKQKFNCQKTTSTGRILDAVAVLLDFAGNERKFKHEAAKLLEENSTTPYNDLELRIKNYESRKILDTTHLFEYLIENIHKDKKRLAATAQQYIAQGVCEIIKNHDSKFVIHDSCFAAGGMTNNKIISSYLENQGVYLAKKIPKGDEGIAVGQIVYCLLNKKYPMKNFKDIFI